MGKACLMCNKVNGCKVKSYVVCEINKQWEERLRSGLGREGERREEKGGHEAWCSMGEPV